MYILNITINIDDSVHSSCLEWIKSVLPSFLAETKISHDFAMLHVMSEAIQNGSTYTLQFHLSSTEKIALFEKLYNQKIAAGLYLNFPDKCIEFRTTLKQVEWAT